MQEQETNNQDMYDIIIVGAGPSGLFGAFYAGMRKMKTLIIDALPEMGGQLVALYPEKYVYDVPGFPEILAKDLAKNLAEQALRQKPDVRLGERVTNLNYLDEEKQTIEIVTDHNAYKTKTVLVAAGVGAFKPNSLNVPGIEQFDGNGVYYFVQDLNTFAGKNVLIVGGGDSAVDWALELSEKANQVTLIHRRDQFRAHEASVDSLMASSVDVNLFHELKGIYGNDHIESATIFHNKTQEERTIPVDAVILSLGFKSDLGPIKEWGLPIEKRSIVVNRDYSTNLPGVFASGDVAGTPIKLDLIAVACAQAAVAVNTAKTYIDPSAKFFAGHSSSATPK